MGARGRKPKGALTVVTPEQVKRLEPPADMKERDAAMFREIVAKNPADQFKVQDVPLLREYCEAAGRSLDAQEYIDLFGLYVFTDKGVPKPNPASPEPREPRPCCCGSGSSPKRSAPAVSSPSRCRHEPVHDPLGRDPHRAVLDQPRQRHPRHHHLAAARAHRTARRPARARPDRLREHPARPAPPSR